MKRILALLLLGLFVSAQAEAAISYVQKTTYVNPNVQFQAAQSYGNTNFIVVSVTGTATAPTGVGDTVNGSYTLVSSTGNATISLYLYAKFNILGSAGGVNKLTITPPSGATSTITVGTEYSGIVNTTDGSIQTGSGSGTALSTTNLVTTNANDLILSLGAINVTSTITGGTNYTLRWYNGNGANSAQQDQIVSATGTFGGGMTSSATGTWVAMQLAYEANTNPPGPQTWVSNGADTGGSGTYVAGTQSVQYCHDTFANAGDTITLPTGSFTWANGVSIAKSVFILGSGYTPNTAINCSNPGAPTLATTITWTHTGSGGNGPTAFTVNLGTAGGSNYLRLSGLSFTGSVASSSAQQTYFVISGSPGNDPFRVDNCVFDGGTNQVVMGGLWGNPTGCVFDHCTFKGGGASEMVHNNANGSSSQAGWLDDITPGTNQSIYFEDNIFEFTGYASATGQLGTCGFQTYYGARTVARYNRLNFTLFDFHGNINPNTRWFEVYKNQLFIPSTNTGNTFLAQPRGGSGVIWGNTFASGSQTSLGAIISFYTDETSANNLSPSVAGPQPGYGPGAGIFASAGTSQGGNSSPVYVWGNDSAMSVNHVAGTGGWDPLTINGTGANIYTSTTQPSPMTISETAAQRGGATYNYTPFTYPHPLTGLSQQAPPTNQYKAPVGPYE